MLDKGQIVEIPASSPIYQRKHPDFRNKKEELQWYAAPYRYGLFDGILVGGHQGTEKFQPGQRKHLNISGMPSPMYVIAIDRDEERIFVGAGKNHPGLYAKVFFFPNTSIRWTNQSFEHFRNTDTALRTEVRTGQNAAIASAYLYDEGIYLSFDTEQNIALYHQNTILLTLLHERNVYAEIHYHL